jgi:WD40 repeat protein
MRKQDSVYRLVVASDCKRLVWIFTGHGLEVLSANFHPDGNRIASGGHDRSILIEDSATGAELMRLSGHSWYLFSLAFSPDGETLVSGSGDAAALGHISGRTPPPGAALTGRLRNRRCLA